MVEIYLRDYLAYCYVFFIDLYVQPLILICAVIS